MPEYVKREKSEWKRCEKVKKKKGKLEKEKVQSLKKNRRVKRWNRCLEEGED